MTMKKMSIWGLVAVCATGILAGCNESEIHTSAFAQTPPAPAQGQGKAAKLNADAGVPIGVAATPTAFDDAKAKSFATRTNAFSLLPTEAKFNKEQTAARLVGELGGFGMFYEPPPPKPDLEETIEPQPRRRLAGVLLGASVIALIEMEDGKVYDVRPGSKIPNSEWTVVSIDEERAILRRGGTKLPKQVEVRLESRPIGSGGGNSGGGNTGGGNTGGGGVPGPGKGGMGAGGGGVGGRDD